MNLYLYVYANYELVLAMNLYLYANYVYVYASQILKSIAMDKFIV